ncbi:related to E4 ubiquitin-protein ligase UFD2 [Saccharomycodes ludwigii]|uniref:RING-type E3 ubiquitin transferase n=1 Tax=Saccharomycodes ludwigii TaxID=36035 RepID=A0A376B4Z3_9ASCO|nr:related to E4 ubiquitin-protein ligase UFD2 [Saccharomycodes ludwigii]
MTLQESVIEDIFKIYTNNQKHDIQNSAEYTFINTEDIPENSTLTIDLIDSILIYQLTENENLRVSPIDYLNNCYSECDRFKRILPAENENDLNMIQSLISNYGLVIFQIEDFCCIHTGQGEEEEGSVFRSYVKKILSRYDDYTAFLYSIVLKSIEQGETLTFLNNFFNTLLGLMSDLDMMDSLKYSQVLSIFEFFVSIKPCACIFTQIDSFSCFSRIATPDLERKTLLGPILSLSPLQIKVASKMYYKVVSANISLAEDDRSNEDTLESNRIHETLQTEHNVILNRLFFITDKLLRAGETSRTDLIKYFGDIVNANHLRRGDHADVRKLSSDAFMCNILILLARFSMPFLDITYTKLNKIDMNYFNNVNHLFIDISNESCMNSDIKEAQDYFANNGSNDLKRPNFISDCFFLTLTYLHYGIGGAILQDDKLERHIKFIIEEYNKALKFKNAPNTPSFMQSMLNSKIEKMSDQIVTFKAQRKAFQGLSVNKSIQLELFEFVCGASTFLIRVIDPTHTYPAKQISLPLIPDQLGVENVDNFEYLRENAPVPFKYYPEYLIEGLVNYCQYSSRFYVSPIVNKAPRTHSFIELCTVILRCPELISNPHLKGKMVNVLSMGCLPQNGGHNNSNNNITTSDFAQGFLIDILSSNELCLKHLLFSLLDFYVIVEKTGSSSQFYDKFNSRYHISLILEQLYKIPNYKSQLILQSRTNPDFFTRFIARMLNDLTFLLDEGLSSLQEVHNIQQELNRRKEGRLSMREENMEELLSKLKSAGRQARSSCGLSDKSMLLFNTFTRDIPGAFTIPEIVDRLASMLDYNLECLVGPKCRELIVKNPEKYSFNPKTLLKDLCTVYINLSDEESFVAAVAKDGRSFHREFFDKAVQILRDKIGFINDEFSQKLIDFANAAQEEKLAEEEQDLEMNDCPDEFLDPLMFTIMTDPVILPTSKVSIDRNTIKQHLLSDSTDPFNRMPLKLEDVIPNTELKNQIEVYKLKKKTKT